MEIEIRCKGADVRDVDSLVAFQGELKSLSSERYEALKGEITTTGFAFPIHIWQSEGKDYIVAGHQRARVLLKLRQEGYIIPPVPVVFVEADTYGMAKRRVMQDVGVYGVVERQGLREFMDTAQIDMEELKEAFKIPDMDMAGFEAEFFKDNVVPPEDPGEGSLPVEPKTVTGDLWILGEHRVLCGDATSIDAVEKLMGPDRADMVFTDPPYNTGMTAKNMNGSTWLTHFFNDAFTDEEWRALLEGFTANAWIAMKDNSVAYVCLDWRRSHELVPHLKKHFKFSNLIVWDKVVHGLGSDYQYTHEFIHVCKKGDPTIDSHQGDREYQDVWRIQRVMGRDEDHATKKPLELVERAIRHACPANGIVLDLFGGSGSTLLAAERTQRRARLIELDQRYVDTTLTRWAKATGKDPVREDGVLWSSLQSQAQESPPSSS